MKTKKKVLFVGVGPDRQAVFQHEMGGHKTVFLQESKHALGHASTADVTVVHVDSHPCFIDSMITRGYRGHFVPITTSPKLINKQIKLPGRLAIDHVSWKTASQAITRALQAPEPVATM